MEQLALFEPTGAVIPVLVLGHIKKAGQFFKAADVFRSNGWLTLADSHERGAAGHLKEAEELAMLADFEKLGGVYQ